MRTLGIKLRLAMGGLVEVAAVQPELHASELRAGFRSLR
jgi:hypothetical protein